MKKRKIVFQRDKFICRICKKEGRLHCHHIQQIPINGLIDIDDLKNLLTLCNRCHWLWHYQPEKNKEFKERIIPFPEECEHLGIAIVKALIYQINFGYRFVSIEKIFETLEKMGFKMEE